MNIRSIIISAVPILLCIAGRGSAEDRILFASEVNLLPLGACASAMGDAQAAYPYNIASAYYNPATPSLVQSRELWAEGARLYGMSNQGLLAFGTPVQDALSAAILYAAFFPGEIPLQLDTLPETYDRRKENPDLRADGSSDGYFTDNSHQVILSLSRCFAIPTPRPAGVNYPVPLDVAFGLNVKYAWEVVSLLEKVRMGMNVNVDIGLLVRLGVDYDMERQKANRQICIGGSIRDAIPSNKKWVNSDYTEPVDNSQMYGISYIDDAGIGIATWRISMDLHRAAAGDAQAGDTTASHTAIKYGNTYHYGIAVGLWRIIEFRAGLSNRIPTLGAGLSYKNYRIDYAFRFDRIDYSPMRISLGFVF